MKTTVSMTRAHQERVHYARAKRKMPHGNGILGLSQSADGDLSKTRLHDTRFSSARQEGGEK